MSTSRSSDIAEGYGEKALIAGIGGLVAVVVGAMLLKYQTLPHLAWMLIVPGIAAIGYGAYWGYRIKSIDHAQVICPYCRARNDFVTMPDSDERCQDCHRMMPIVNSIVLRVEQVRCGYCGHLNFYSEKSVGLLCEECDHDIPIATEGGSPSSTGVYASKEDTKRYDLMLVEAGGKTEALINYLQHLLALNRNQVKDMLATLPCTLLVGIPALKAEMITKEAAKHGAKCQASESR